MNVRVLLADDHQIIRDGLRALLEKQKGIEVVAEAANGRQTVHLARQHKPSVVITDISMPDLNGVEAARQIREAVPGARIIALSMHSDKRYVGAMLRAGANAYLLKECAFDELVHALHAVMKGETYLSSRIVGAVVDDYVKRLEEGENEAAASGLSARHREVLQLIAEGHSTKQIAAALHVSVKTIETHRRQIMDRLGVSSVAELTKYAVRQGLTALE